VEWPTLLLCRHSVYNTLKRKKLYHNLEHMFVTVCQLTFARQVPVTSKGARFTTLDTPVSRAWVIRRLLVEWVSCPTCMDYVLSATALNRVGRRRGRPQSVQSEAHSG